MQLSFVDDKQSTLMTALKRLHIILLHQNKTYKMKISLHKRNTLKASYVCGYMMKQVEQKL